MKNTIARLAGALLALTLTTGLAAAQSKVTIAIGGGSCLCYLPTVLAKQLGEYDKAGLNVELVDLKGGSDALKAVLGGSADVVSGYFDHCVNLAAKKQELQAFVVYDRYPGLVLVVSPSHTNEIKSIKDLAGKKVAILPGSTQEVVILDRLKMEGMSIKDIQPIRVSFSDMPAALERGDIDAYVGAEPGPSISVAKGVGKIVEFPYSTPTGSVNMVMTTHDLMIKENAELVKVFLAIHRKATEYAMSNRAAFVDMAALKLGQPRPTIEIAAPNVELTWNTDADWVIRAKYYGSEMLDKKQIRALPDYAKFINTSFATELAKTK